MSSERNQAEWREIAERECTSNSVPLTGDIGGTSPVTSIRVRGEINIINSIQESTSLQECDAHAPSTRFNTDSLTGSAHEPHSSTNADIHQGNQSQFQPLSHQSTHQRHSDLSNHAQRQNVQQQEPFSDYSHQPLPNSVLNPQDIIEQGFTYLGVGVHECQICRSKVLLPDLKTHREQCSAQSDVCQNKKCHKPKDQIQPKTPAPPVTRTADAKKTSYRCHQQIKYPKYADYMDRVNSFPKKWRASANTSLEFASAGFYYFGAPDKVVCFSCGRGFQDWKDDDEPWKEHARLSQNCTYVAQVKGSQFVEQQRARSNIPSLPTRTNGSTNNWQQLDSLTSGMSNVSLDTTPSFQVDQNTYQILMDMGYKSDIIQRALTKHQSKRSQTDVNLILDEILAMNDETKEKAKSEYCFLCKQELRNGFTLLPCGHLAVCVKCDVRKVKHCPVCKEEVKEYVRTTVTQNQ